MLSPGCADLLGPKVIRAGSGAHFHLPVETASRWEDVTRLLDGHGALEQVLLMDAAGHVAYDAADFSRRTTLIIGNEAHGASPQAARLATEHISIPMWNLVESLNAAIAASVVLFEAARQRRMSAETTE